MSQTLALAPKLPALLDSMKDEIAAALKVSLDADKIEAKAQHILFTQLAEQVKSRAEQIAGLQYYEPDSLPTKTPENIAQFRVAMNRMLGYLDFRETLDRFKREQDATAKALEAGGTDFDVEM